MCDTVDDYSHTYSGGVVGSWVYTGARAGSAYGGQHEGSPEMMSDEGSGEVIVDQPLPRGPSGY
jgi:hypothetical protein